MPVTGTVGVGVEVLIGWELTVGIVVGIETSVGVGTKKGVEVGTGVRVGVIMEAEGEEVKASSLLAAKTVNFRLTVSMRPVFGLVVVIVMVCWPGDKPDGGDHAQVPSPPVVVVPLITTGDSILIVRLELAGATPMNWG